MALFDSQDPTLANGWTALDILQKKFPALAGAVANAMPTPTIPLLNQASAQSPDMAPPDAGQPSPTYRLPRFL